MNVKKKMRQQSRHLPAFILLHLAFGPSHGGALRTELNTRLPGLNADSGAVYRALLQMEKEGEVESKWDASRPGPARRIYSITAAGFSKLGTWKDDIERRCAILGHFLKTYAKLPRPSNARRPRTKHRLD
jgi:DNA-binding PadR family transcriptional regulator